jgi:hypothetical protein
VTAGYSYYWRSSKTNSQGYFASPERWTYSVKYEAHWDADDFLLEDGESWYGADLYTEGPTSYSAWNRTFVGQNARYATIFTAAYNYYYGVIDGLPRPLQNGWLSQSLDLQIYDSQEGPVRGGFLINWYVSYIDIYTNTTWGHHNSQTLYATTTHELAHSAHYASFNTRYVWMSREHEFGGAIQSSITESYAVFCSWYLTNKKYPGYIWSTTHYEPYTSIFQDLFDYDNEVGNTESFSDGFGGFSIADINDLVQNSFYWSELRNRAINKYPDKEAEILYLFNYWIQ